MKIAFFHELPLGGARRVVEEYGKLLAKKHTVDLFYVDTKEEVSITAIFGKTYFFPFFQKRNRLYNDTISLFLLSILHKQIAQVIDKESYDFVVVNPSKYTQAPFLLRYITTYSVYFCQEPLRIVHDPFLKKLPQTSLIKKSYEFVNRLFRRTIDYANMKKSGLVLANSMYAANWIKASYGRVANTCYLGVDADFFVPQASNKTYDILFLGQMIEVEGYDLLEKALDFFKEKPIVHIVARDNLGGGISDRQLVSTYNKAKIVVCLSRNEPFGLTALEAGSCGVPVVVVNEGGFRESVVNGKTGFLVERDSIKLYEKLQFLLKNNVLRNSMGKNSREEILAKWTWQKSVECFMDIVIKWQQNK